MTLYSFNPSAKPLLHGYYKREPNDSFKQHAFTLPEVLASVVVLTIAVIGSIAAVNLIFFSIRGTETRADQNRAIDGDVSRIVTLSEEYGACAVLAGTPGDACAGALPGDSFYYFPADAGSDVDGFVDACEDGSLVDGFITAIAAPDDPGAGVVRAAVVPVDADQEDNHLVRVTWTEGAGGRVLRTIQFVPLVAAWCP